MLAVQSSTQLAARIRRARELKKPIIWGIGGHVIKTGLAPVIIDLMKRGYVSAIAANGSVLVHDAEIAMVGSTSEDVDATLSEGVFGGAEETANYSTAPRATAREIKSDSGEAVGRPARTQSKASRLLPSLHRIRIEDSLHRAHHHRRRHRTLPSKLRRRRTRRHNPHRLSTVSQSWSRRMDGGGVYLNVGSAVVLPEVFLKCVTLVRNLGHPLSDITTANFDFIQSYRPLTNVVRRPTENGAGQGFSITGHHELTIPLRRPLDQRRFSDLTRLTPLIILPSF